jgi:glycosyltransferase involved in cell wall biosynthesis
VVILRNEKRKGYGYALKLGLLLSRKYCATFAITLDADAQHNPDDIPKFINELLSLNTDIVIGNRFKGKSHVPTTDAMIIKLISYIFSSIINFKIEDTLCGFRALRLALLDDMAIEKISDDMGFPLELLAIAIRKGWRIKEVPVKVRYHNLSKRGLARKSIQLVQILRSLIRVFLEVSIG